MNGGAARTASAMPAYRHTQSGRLIAGLIGTGVVAVSVVTGTRLAAAGAPRRVWVGLALAEAVVLGLAGLFSTFTVEVDAGALRWHFALGAFRRTVPRAEIAAVEPTRTTLLDGIGIHRGPRGWVYNVALGPAVRVVRQDGRAFLLGTDDAGGLVAALAPRVSS